MNLNLDFILCCSKCIYFQVVDPPQIKVQPVKPNTPNPSRFSVSRNYDAIYSVKPMEVKTDVKSDNKDSISDSNVTKVATNVPASDVKRVPSDVKSDVKETKYHDKSEEVSHNESIKQQGGDTVHVSETKLVKSSTEVSGSEKVDVKVEVTVTKETLGNDSVSNKSDKNVNIVNNPPAKVYTDQNSASVLVGERVCAEIKNIDDVCVRNVGDNTMKKIEAVITNDLNNIIQEMGDLSNKTHLILARKSESVDVKSDSTQTEVSNEQIYDVIVPKDDISVPVSLVRENVVLKKNKSESSLDSPDLEVSRLMNKKVIGSAFCDSNSSFSGSSMESLNNPDVHNISQIIISKPDNLQSNIELDRRKTNFVLSTESSLDSNNSELTPINSGLLNTSISSNESVSPIPFSKDKKIHGSLSSLEVSVSSLDSARGLNQEKAMVTSADSGIEHSLQNPSDIREDSSSNEGTLTHNFNYKDLNPELLKGSNESGQSTLTSSPKRTSSLLDVPAFKSKSLDRVRKISWVAPSSSFHIPKEHEPPKQESKLPLHLEKLLSLFQHPSALFSRNNSEEEKKSASNTPPRKESTSLTSSFWSWGASSSAEKSEKEDKVTSFEDKDSSPEEATDSTLSERVQVSFIDESFSKKLDSKTPSTDTDNTLSELPVNYTSETSDISQQECFNPEKINKSYHLKQLAIEDTKENVLVAKYVSTENNIVQKHLDLSLKNADNTAGESQTPVNCDITKQDLIGQYENPNDLNRNYAQVLPSANTHSSGFYCDNITKLSDTLVHFDNKTDSKVDCKVNAEVVRPRTFAGVLKSTSSNSLDKQITPDAGQSIDKLPSKVIRGIKENISPENTLTSSMTNTKTLAQELTETRQTRTPDNNQQIINSLWDVSVSKLENIKSNEPIPKNETGIPQGISKSCDDSTDKDIQKHRDLTINNPQVIEIDNENDTNKLSGDQSEEIGNIDVGKDALALLDYDQQDFEPEADNIPEIKSKDDEKTTDLAEELRDAEMKQQMLDLSPELIVDEALNVPEIFTTKDIKGLRSSPVIPERAKLKKCSSLEELSQRLQILDLENKENPTKKSAIVFKIPETASTPKDIPDSRRYRLRTRSGSSPKSLPENFIKSPICKLDAPKKKKKISSLGKIARDSLLALNMSEEEIAEFRRSYKLTSVESLRSLSSVSEDANSQSGNSLDSRCRVCLRTSQESLMSLDSISEDCRCGNRDVCEERSHSAR